VALTVFKMVKGGRPFRQNTAKVSYIKACGFAVC